MYITLPQPGVLHEGKHPPMRPPRLAILFFVLVAATPSHAARCGGDFNTFIASVSADAQGAGISPSVVSSALGGVSEDAAGFDFCRPPRHTLHKTFAGR